MARAPALRLPVTGSSRSRRPSRKNALTSNRLGRPARIRADDAEVRGRAPSGLIASTVAASGSRRRPSRGRCRPTLRRRLRRMQREHVGDVREQRLFDRTFAQQRRRSECELPAAALDAQPHEAGAALLHDLIAALAGRPRRPPGVAAAERRMAGERQLEHGREDPQSVVGLRRRRRQQEGRLREVGPAA